MRLWFKSSFVKRNAFFFITVGGWLEDRWKEAEDNGRLGFFLARVLRGLLVELWPRGIVWPVEAGVAGRTAT